MIHYNEKVHMSMNIKEVAELIGISVQTLLSYDQIIRTIE